MANRFEEFTWVTCDSCQNYYTNTCDGVAKGSESLCTAFIATRGADIPAQIAWLRKAVKYLSVSVSLLGIAVAMQAICLIWG